MWVFPRERSKDLCTDPPLGRKGIWIAERLEVPMRLNEVARLELTEPDPVLVAQEGQHIGGLTEQHLQLIERAPLCCSTRRAITRWSGPGTCSRTGGDSGAFHHRKCPENEGSTRPDPDYARLQGTCQRPRLLILHLHISSASARVHPVPVKFSHYPPPPLVILLDYFSVPKRTNCHRPGQGRSARMLVCSLGI
jgi:hypothetical protein